MRTRALVLFAVPCAALLAFGVWYLAKPRPVAKSPFVAAKPLPIPATSDAPALKAFVERHAKTKDPQTRDRVGAARMRLAYSVARTDGYAKARTSFLEVAKTHRGTGAQSAAFGGIADGAAYQAVCCLVGEGKNAEAEKGFETFLKERPLSPLVHAAYRRLARLNDGESKPEWDKLLQSAVTAQEKRIRFETSVCGPKCLERILQNPSLWGGGSTEKTSANKGNSKSFGARLQVEGVGSKASCDYRSLAKLCGTTDDGTTVEGMRRGLKALGRESWAARLNRDDLAKATLPAIVLEGDHYVVLERIEGDGATVWDPRFAAARPWKLPPGGDPDFTANVILLQKPEGL